VILLNLRLVNNGIDIKFDFRFPFLRELSKENVRKDNDELLRLLCNSVNKVETEIVLSLSGGKDSLAILLALLNNNQKFETFTYKSPLESDETEYVSWLSKEFNFKSMIFCLNDNQTVLKKIWIYFINLLILSM
jgi:asparagine synthetase B (glutamine-hydrolysing)